MRTVIILSARTGKNKGCGSQKVWSEPLENTSSQKGNDRSPESNMQRSNLMKKKQQQKKKQKNIDDDSIQNE